MGTGKPLAEQGLMFTLAPGSVDAARAFIERLVADGGSQPMPFAQAPSGDHYGQVLDQHGLLWHVNVPG